MGEVEFQIIANMESVRIVRWWDSDCNLVEELRVLDFTCLELLFKRFGNLKLYKLTGLLVCLAHKE